MNGLTRAGARRTKFTNRKVARQQRNLVRARRPTFQVGGGKAGKCDEVDEFIVYGDPTGGDVEIEYTLVPDPDDPGTEVTDTITLAYNSSGGAAKTAFEAHSAIDTNEVTVVGGPWPNNSLHVIWGGRYSGRNVEFPTVDFSGLTGINLSVHMRKSSSVNWKGYQT